MPIDITAILKDLGNKILDLAKTSFKDALKQATSDGKAFWDDTQDDVARWIGLLSQNQITQLEFETLVIGKTDLFKMKALTQAGLTQVRIDEFKVGVINLITETIFKII